MGEARVGAFDAGLLVGALAVDPVAEIGVDQLFQRAPAFAVRRGEAVVVDERMETVAPPVPDVPDERALVEQLAMLRKETIAQPVIKRLAGEAVSASRLASFAADHSAPNSIGKERVQALFGRRFALQGRKADDAVIVSVLLEVVHLVRATSGDCHNGLTRPSIAKEKRERDLERTVGTFGAASEKPLTWITCIRRGEARWIALGSNSPPTFEIKWHFDQRSVGDLSFLI